MECRYCGELIADLESAPKDSMGAYCETCEIEDVVDTALMDANDEGEIRPAMFIRSLELHGFAIVKKDHYFLPLNLMSEESNEQ